MVLDLSDGTFLALSQFFLFFLTCVFWIVLMLKTPLVPSLLRTGSQTCIHSIYNSLLFWINADPCQNTLSWQSSVLPFCILLFTVVQFIQHPLCWVKSRTHISITCVRSEALAVVEIMNCDSQLFVSEQTDFVWSNVTFSHDDNELVPSPINKVWQSSTWSDNYLPFWTMLNPQLITLL